MNKLDKQLKHTVIWLAMSGLTILIFFIGSRDTSIIDRFYHDGMFQFIRVINDYTIGLLPFPAVYLLFIGLLYFLWSRLIMPMVKRKANWKIMLLGLLRFLSISVVLFYLLWGLNYAQSPVEERIGMEMKGMTDQDLRTEFDLATNELSEIANQILDKNWTVDALKEKRFNEKEARDLIESVFDALGYQTLGKVRGRLLYPKGTLLVWNTAGIYIPFVGEGHVDGGMLAIQHPYVMTHEMSHGYGITDEGSCNFLAYLACRSSTNVFIRFSGVLGYWRYVASEFRRSHPDEYREKLDSLPPLVIESLVAIRDNNDSYPEWMPQVRYKVYDSYLKAQGIEEGMRNYSRVVQLVHAWRKTTGD